MRELTQNERGVLEWMLADPDLPAGDALRAQIPHVLVAGGFPTWLELKVSGAAPADVPNGKLPVDAVVQSSSGEVTTGFILVWIEQGYLYGLEHAWVTDETPEEFPSPDRLLLWDTVSNRTSVPPWIW